MITEQLEKLIHEYGKFKHLQGQYDFHPNSPPRDLMRQIDLAHSAIVEHVVAAEVISKVIADDKLKIEVRAWRSVLGLLGSTPVGCGNAILAKYDEYQAIIEELRERISELRGVIEDMEAYRDNC